MSIAKEPKQKRAIALEYQSLDVLPQVTAAGVGEAAREILELAEKANVPIHKDEALTDLLHTVSPGDVIDSRTFRLVAEVISFLYYTDKEWQASHGFLDPVLRESRPDSLEGMLPPDK